MAQVLPEMNSDRRRKFMKKRSIGILLLVWQSAPALAGAAARVLQMLMKNLYRQKKKQKQKTKKKML